MVRIWLRSSRVEDLDEGKSILDGDGVVLVPHGPAHDAQLLVVPDQVLDQPLLVRHLHGSCNDTG